LPGKDGIYPLQYHCDASGTYKLSIFLDGIIVGKHEMINKNIMHNHNHNNHSKYATNIGY